MLRFPSRWQLLMAALLVGAGCVLTAAGPRGVARLAILAVDNAGILLVALAVTALVTAVAPRGTVAGPVLVGVAGLGLLAWRYGLWSNSRAWTVAGVVMALGGGWFIMRAARNPSDDIDPFRRVVGALFPKTAWVGTGSRMPLQLSVVSVGTRIVVHVADAATPGVGYIEVQISCWAGRVELWVSENLPVVAGRLSAAHAVRFFGKLDSARLIPTPEEQGTEIDDVLAEHRRRVPDPGPGHQHFAVVVHVLGIGGEVSLHRTR